MKKIYIIKSNNETNLFCLQDNFSESSLVEGLQDYFDQEITIGDKEEFIKIGQMEVEIINEDYCENIYIEEVKLYV